MRVGAAFSDRCDGATRASDGHERLVCAGNLGGLTVQVVRARLDMHSPCGAPIGHLRICVRA